jgi:putative ABC transport system permease protein
MLGEVWRRIGNLFRREKFDRELSEEMRLHHELREREEREAGVGIREARDAAKKRFGNELRLREESRGMWGWKWAEDFFQDIRYGLRVAGKNPGFSSIVVLTLGLGIGATTAVFGVADAVLLRPLPYRQEGQIVMVWETQASRAQNHNVVSPANFLYWQEHNTVFDQMAAFYDSSTSILGDGDPEQIPMQAVSEKMFPLLGISPILGRNFSAEEDVDGHDQVAILSYGLWQRRFGGDPQIVGKSIQLGFGKMEIVGVMPASARLFVAKGSLTGEAPQLWIPVGWGATQRVPRGRYMMAVARLKAGVMLAEAEGELNSLSRTYAKQYPDFETGWGVTLVPIHDEMSGGIRQSLLVLLGAVAFVLLIACANVANLVLSQSAVREREIAVRVALGAARWRIIRQTLTESLLLAVAGGGLGFLAALWGSDALLSLAPKNLLGAQEIHMDYRVLLFTVAISVLTGIVLGVVPAYDAGRVSLTEPLREGGRNLTGLRGRRLRNSFAVAEIALSLVLLAGAGLLIRSFSRLMTVDPGFNSSNLLMMRISLRSAKYPQGSQTVQFFQQLLERVRAIPGVRGATIDNSFPLTGMTPGTDFIIAGRPAAPLGADYDTEVQMVDGEYFHTMGIPLLRGRTFNNQEGNNESHVVIISEALARQYFPNETPIGKKIVIHMKQKNEPSEIIGVVGDVKRAGLDATPVAMSYWPHSELPITSMMLGIRTESNPMAFVGSVREIVHQMDADLPVYQVETLEQWMGDSVARQRFSALLLGLFAGIAFLLAIIGIYGVVAYAVSQRTREFGVRMALGAESGDIAWLVLRQGLNIAGFGIVLGLAGALGVSQFLRQLLFHVSPYDPMTFFCVAIAMSGVTLLACWLPARRATKVDPIIALRYE